MARRFKVVRLPKAKVDDEDVFIRTLVHVLDMARRGKVTGYAAVFDMVEDDGGRRTSELAAVLGDEPGLALTLLGGIRRMEVNFMDRVFGAPNSERGVDDA